MVVVVAAMVVIIAAHPERGAAAVVDPHIASVIIPAAPLAAVGTGQLAVQRDIAGVGQCTGLVAVVAAFAGDKVIRAHVGQRGQE